MGQHNMDSDRTIKLVIPGEPKFQQRHRSVIMPRKGCKAIQALNKTTGEVEKLYRKKDLFLRNYDPSYKDKIDALRWIRCLAPERKLRGPVRVDRFYYFSYRACDYGTGKNAGALRASAPKWKSTRPDIDNFDKFLFDILSGVFFEDDGQIAAGVQTKQYSEHPRTEVYITPLSFENGKEELENELYIQTNRPVAPAKNQKTQELTFSEFLSTNS
jgi:Holliday junction resolvase RusA-like endonuclease